MSPLGRHRLKILSILVLRDRLTHLVILIQIAQGHLEDLAGLRPVVPGIGVMGQILALTLSSSKTRFFYFKEVFIKLIVS